MNKINYSKKETINSPIEKKDAKVRVTTYIDFDVLSELKKQAKDSGEKYQTLLNKILREVVLGRTDLSSILKDLDVKKLLKDYGKSA